MVWYLHVNVFKYVENQLALPSVMYTGDVVQSIKDFLPLVNKVSNIVNLNFLEKQNRNHINATNMDCELQIDTNWNFSSGLLRVIPPEGGGGCVHMNCDSWTFVTRPFGSSVPWVFTNVRPLHSQLAAAFGHSFDTCITLRCAWQGAWLFSHKILLLVNLISSHSPEMQNVRWASRLCLDLPPAWS